MKITGLFFATHREPTRMSGACEFVMSGSAAGSPQHPAAQCLTRSREDECPKM